MEKSAAGSAQQPELDLDLPKLIAPETIFVVSRDKPRYDRNIGPFNLLQDSNYNKDELDTGLEVANHRIKDKQKHRHLSLSEKQRGLHMILS